jgi:hypothetical protein
MTNPSTVAAALAASLAHIPGVVTALGEDPTLIAVYSGLLRLEAIQNLSSPAIFIVWNGSGSGGPRGLWTHRYSLILRADDPASLFAAIANGTPVGTEEDPFGDGQAFRRTRIHSSCDPIDSLACEYRYLPVDERSGIDYFEVPISLSERGLDV